MYLKQPSFTQDEIQLLLDSLLFKLSVSVGDKETLEQKQNTDLLGKNIIKKLSMNGWKSSENMYLHGDKFEEEDVDTVKHMIEYNIINRKGTK
jgi:hypothetical protein